MKEYQHLRSVIATHPNKLAIITRLSSYLRLSNRSVYRLIKDEQIIGKTGVIALLLNEFAIHFDSENGFKVDLKKLADILDDTEKNARVYGLS